MATLSQLLAFPELPLRLVQAGPGDPEISWSATTELVDLAGYLAGGEVIMTTGLALTEDDPRWRDFVASLSRARVAAIGFGIGVIHDRVPPPLVQAASAYRVALVEIPLPVPFLAVSKAVATLLRSDELRATRSALTAHQQLLDSVREDEDPAAVLASIALATGRHLALVDARGELIAGTAGFSAEQRSLGSAERVALDPEESVHLVVTGDTPLSPEGRSVIAAGAIVLGLRMRGNSVAQRRERTQWERFTEGLLDGAVDPSAARVLDPHFALPDRVRVLGVQGQAEALAGWREYPRTGTERLVTPPAAEQRAAGIRHAWQVIEDSHDALERALAHTGRFDLDAVVGRSAPIAAVGVSRRSAASHLPLLSTTAPLYATPRVPQVVYADRRNPILETILTASDRTAIAGEVLGPLAHGHRTAEPDERLSHAERETLRLTLQRCFEHDGQRGPAAAALGIHRNTLRDRLTRIEQLTGRSLARADDRAELWLALRVDDGPR